VGGALSQTGSVEASTRSFYDFTAKEEEKEEKEEEGEEEEEIVVYFFLLNRLKRFSLSLSRLPGLDSAAMATEVGSV